jgi:hypothetical protein
MSGADISGTYSNQNHPELGDDEIFIENIDKAASNTLIKSPATGSFFVNEDAYDLQPGERYGNKAYAEGTMKELPNKLPLFRKKSGRR